MYAKVILVATALAAISAQEQGHHGRGHEHAYSSQSIVLHQSHEPSHYVELQHGHQEHHGNEVQLHGHEVQNHGHEVQHHGHEVQYHGHEVQHHGHEAQHHGQEVQHHGYEVQYHGQEEQHGQGEQHHGHHEEHHVDYYAHPKYEYEYKVQDPHTHDFKSQHEHRDGDAVKGEYSLHQPDGTIRVVKYYADKKTGFHADVKYEGHAKHIVPDHHHQH